MKAKYELRQLTAKDIFSMSRVIGKIGLNNFKRCFDNEELKALVSGLSEEEKKDDKKVTAVGMTVALEVADVLFAHLPDCEKELYQFLSGISGLKVPEIQELSMGEFFEMIVAVVKKPEFKDFFKVASRSFK